MLHDLHLNAHVLQFEAEALTPIRWHPFKGSSLRGAWYGYLKRAYCTAPPQARQDPRHAERCPVCYLTARENGPEARRPYAFRPPLARRTELAPGERFTFGLVLFGPAWLLLPYVLTGMIAMGEYQGVGAYLPDLGHRGLFHIRRVDALNPLTGQRELVLHDRDRQVHLPSWAIHHEHVERHAQELLKELQRPGSRLILDILTPMRLIHQGRLVRQGFAFEPFFARLLERLYRLAEDYGTPPPQDPRATLREARTTLQEAVAQVQVLADHTRWWDVQGFSRRTKRKQYLGGLVGRVELKAPPEVWALLLPALVWGQITHVGKNVVKGAGWYKLSSKAEPEA